ncbi:MAG: SDR family oxidoreductase [bacterium]|nr:short-chain dehydrogenase [Deltaproteobacteria bacterium]MCP4906219.1 SDR family oxidoreductase [bacterium]
MLLNGKVAIVSGVGPGMGRDTALALATHGADVVLMARSEEVVIGVAPEIEAVGRKACIVLGDITDQGACERVAKVAAEEFGRIDILVNNAFFQGERKPLMEVESDDWRRVLEVNLLGSMNMTRAVVPFMEERGEGRIIMVNSMQGLRTVPGGFGPYASSKAALASITKTLAYELGPKGIRVNGIHPGMIMGDALRGYFHHLAKEQGCSYEEIHQSISSESALGYIPDSQEYSGTVVYLASDLGKPVTGQSIVTDAGAFR